MNRIFFQLSLKEKKIGYTDFLEVWGIFHNYHNHLYQIGQSVSQVSKWGKLATDDHFSGSNESTLYLWV